MNAIFASKLYRSSPRQSAIKCALADPINVELVQQLQEYLDDTQSAAQPPTEPHPNTSTQKSTHISDDKSSTPKPSIAPVNYIPTTSTKPNPDTNLDDKSANNIPADPNELDDTTKPDDTNKPDDTTKPDDANIASATRIMASDSAIALSSVSNVLLGTLNANNDTCGVDRVSVKGDEVWVYYNDTINLNNRMKFVIELLNASSYSQLMFNRLARTDNAMVFTVSDDDTMKSMGLVPHE